MGPMVVFGASKSKMVRMAYSSIGDQYNIHITVNVTFNPQAIQGKTTTIQGKNDDNTGRQRRQ